MKTNAAILACLLVQMTATALADLPQIPIGTDGSMTVILPKGTHLSLQNEKSGVLISVASTRPVTDGIETTLRFCPMSKGDHDLRSDLLSADNIPLTDLPPLMVRGISSLPGNWTGALTPIAPSPMSHYGGYHIIRIVAIWLWSILLLPVALLARRRKAVVVANEPIVIVPTESSLSDLVSSSANLSAREKHRLEMLLLQLWGTRLGVKEQPMIGLLNTLRSNPETASFLTQVQIWLHAPVERSVAVDSDRLLAPYLPEKTQ